jgi:hypothetical protein
MKGFIRIALGFFMAFGAVGTLDVDPEANLLIQTGLALTGLAVMYWGFLANQTAKNG